MLDFLEREGKSSLTILIINAYTVRPCFPDYSASFNNMFRHRLDHRK